MRGALIVLMMCSTANAGDLCAPERSKTGKTVDLDLKDAPIHDVLRLFADVAKLNLVVSDEVAGNVTLHLRRVSWDRAACAVAATHQLKIVLDGNILLVTPRTK